MTDTAYRQLEVVNPNNARRRNQIQQEPIIRINQPKNREIKPEKESLEYHYLELQKREFNLQQQLRTLQLLQDLANVEHDNANLRAKKASLIIQKSRESLGIKREELEKILNRLDESTRLQAIEKIKTERQIWDLNRKLDTQIEAYILRSNLGVSRNNLEFIRTSSQIKIKTKDGEFVVVPDAATNISFSKTEIEIEELFQSSSLTNRLLKLNPEYKTVQRLAQLNAEIYTQESILPTLNGNNVNILKVMAFNYQISISEYTRGLKDYNDYLRQYEIKLQMFNASQSSPRIGDKEM
jgi:hypothetical protein